VTLIEQPSVLVALPIALTFNLLLCPSTYTVLEALSPLWLALYQPGAPKLLVEFRGRVRRLLVAFFLAAATVLVVCGGVYAYYLYQYVYVPRAIPLASAAGLFPLLVNLLWGFYSFFGLLAVMLASTTQIIVCILHELQLELLLRAIRTRSRDWRLCALIAPQDAWPTLLPRLAQLFSLARTSAGEVRQNPSAAQQDGLAFDPPISTVFDMLKNTQDSINFSAYKATPLFLVTNYTLGIVDVLFAALALSGSFQGAIYIIGMVFAIPISLMSFARLNAACAVFQLKVDQYTALQVVGCECRGAAGGDRARPGARGGVRR
jgi:hypothetical protein